MREQSQGKAAVPAPTFGSSKPAGPVRRWGAGLRRRLRARPDSEHVMSLNRVAFCLAIGTHFAAVVPGGEAVAAAVTGAGLLATACVFAHLLLGPPRSLVRQVAAMVGDISFIGAFMHLGGASMACWYPVILWVILGNGFRLGRANLIRATAIGAAGFGLVILTTPFWRENATLAVGLLAGVVTLPLYTNKLLAKLNEAKRQAEQANEAKSLFLANVSHELRTPLHAIVGLGSLLEQAKLPPEPADMARTIMAASRALLDLIDDVLKLSHSEVGGHRTAELAEFDPVALLDGTQRLIGVRARQKGLKVAVHVGFGTPARLRGDERHIREILTNLAGNALKFTESGGILLAVRPAGDGQAGQGGAASGARLRFEVVDTGIGIAPEAQGRIFEKFSQADRSITERFGGTGLGLAICKRLAELLDGEIGVESRPGRGSTFWFEVECAAAMPGAADEGATGGGGVPDGSPGSASARGAGAVALAVLSIDAEVRPSLRAAARALDPEATIVECAGAAAVRSQLAACCAARRWVLADASASPIAGDSLRDAVRAMGRTSLPSLVLVGAPRPDWAGPDLRWIAPTWVPDDVAELELRAALAVAEAAGGPVLPGDGQAVQAVPADRGPASTPRQASRRLSVLVVDDNSTNRKVMAKIVESGGHRYRLAGDGETALDALEEGGFDLVLMDVNMPVLDGIETTKLYRVASLGRPRLPILALTADATPGMAQRCLDAGMDGCITKPVNASDLLDAIERAATADAPHAAPAPMPVTLPIAPPVPRDGAPGGGGPIPPDGVPEGVPEAVLDEQLLGSLRDVGGDAFVAELLDGFLGDVRQLLPRIRTALGQGDVAAFQFNAHAIGSAAAGMGAGRVRRLSLAMERMRAGEIASQGWVRLRELEEAVDGFATACSTAPGRPRG